MNFKKYKELIDLLILIPQNHPDVANKLATCPFNARHQVPRAEISHHISSCDDKSCIEQDVGKPD